MTRIDIVALEREARQMRAEEIRRLSGIFTNRIGLYVALLGGTLASLGKLIGEALRPLFSWNPQRLRQH